MLKLQFSVIAWVENAFDGLLRDDLDIGKRHALPLVASRGRSRSFYLTKADLTQPLPGSLPKNKSRF